MENEGIKSAKGNISSIKLKTLPNLPMRPPKVFRKIKAESGAQIISENSPRPGKAKLAYPITSIITQNIILGFDSCFVVGIFLI